jgi:hypothetical protein
VICRHCAAHIETGRVHTKFLIPCAVGKSHGEDDGKPKYSFTEKESPPERRHCDAEIEETRSFRASLAKTAQERSSST